VVSDIRVGKTPIGGRGRPVRRGFDINLLSVNHDGLPKIYAQSIRSVVSLEPPFCCLLGVRGLQGRRSQQLRMVVVSAEPEGSLFEGLDWRLVRPEGSRRPQLAG
jgi:hypothetical protein